MYVIEVHTSVSLVLDKQYPVTVLYIYHIKQKKLTRRIGIEVVIMKKKK